MKHAFLITCYKDFETLNDLIEDIQKIKNSKIYISADSKSITFIKKLKLIKKKSYLDITKRQFGSVKHYKDFIKLLETALRDKCDYFHWVDGRTRIIQKSSKFQNFFKKNKHKTFIQSFLLPNKKWGITKPIIKKILHKIIYNNGINRVKYYHLTEIINIQKNKFLFLFASLIFILIQKIFCINRLNFKNYYGGVGYFSLSVNAANYLINVFKKIKDNFNNSFIAEEIISQTILKNSPNNIRRSIVNRSLIYQNWKYKNIEYPGILSLKDLKFLKKKKFFFARKFDSNYKETKILHNKLILK